MEQVQGVAAAVTEGCTESATVVWAEGVAAARRPGGAAAGGGGGAAQGKQKSIS